MATLQLILDVDSDVYPELYAMLVVIGGGNARCERVRQLAATGLLWETLRAHAQLPPGHEALGPRSEGAPKPAARASAPAPVIGKPVASPPRREPPKPAALADDFVDLAIDALPAPPPRPAAAARGAGSLGKELPVLVEVVDPQALTRTSPLPRPGHAAPAEPMTVSASVPSAAAPAPAPAPAPVEGAADGQVTAAAGVPAATSKRLTPRTRLQRMKKMGLFENG